MITIAGSGPSTKLIEHVDVATKKRSVPSNYVFCRFANYHRGKEPLITYYRCNCRRCRDCQQADYQCNGRAWDEYYKQFWRSARPPQRHKPSSGLCAVFAAIERWSPKTVGLIGFDWILDGNPEWEHDAIAERRALLSLVNVKDLRSGDLIRRVRPAGGVCLPRIQSVSDRTRNTAGEHHSAEPEGFAV